MRILHLLSQHPEATGSGITLRNTIGQAARAGHENFLVAGVSSAPEPITGLAAGYGRYIRFGGGDLDFTIPGMSDVMPYPSSRFGALTTAQLDTYEQAFGAAVRFAAAAFMPDIVHSHHLWLATAVARRVLPETPMVTSCHSSELRQFVTCPHLQQRVLPYCRQLDRVLALSSDQADKIRSLYGIPAGQIDLVGGGFNHEIFRYGEKAEPPPVRLLYAGKLSYAKGVDWLLRTVATLNDNTIHLELVGAGSGAEAKDCRAQAARLGSAVTVHGQLDQAALAAVMRRCHICILPSFYEGMPLVLLEALAAGCRLITTDLPGSRELLRDVAEELAMLVELPVMPQIDRPEPADWAALDGKLAHAIRTMVAKVRLHPSLSEEVCSRAVARHTWPSVFGRMEKSYIRALAG